MVEILLGVFNVGEDYRILLNHLILVAKFYVYKRKLTSLYIRL